MYWINRARRAVIRLLIGRMEVCCNMIVDGEVSYCGRYGGAICENNRFVVRSQAGESR
jgi:hypothetical protein